MTIIYGTIGYVAAFAFSMWYGHLRYRNGICDGAFNHFLPVVRREMINYDARRASIIFTMEHEGLYHTPLQRWCHVKSGGKYIEIARGQLEATLEPVVIYRAQGSAGRVWVRPAAEFDDGRFVQIGSAG
jgi:hypothetical protein